MGEVGTVTVKVVPDAKMFHSELSKQFLARFQGKAFYQAGRRAGKRWSDGFNQGIQDRNIGKMVASSVAAGLATGLAGAATQRKVKKDSDALGATAASAAASGARRQTKREQQRWNNSDNYIIPQLAGTKAASGLLQNRGMTKAAIGFTAVGASLLAIAGSAYVATKGIQAYGKASSYVLQQAGQLEQTNIALTTLLGDRDKAQALLRDSIEFSKQTPFDLPAVTQGVRQLKAYGFAAKDLIPLMRDIGDSAAALGIGPEGIQRLILALGQIKARGTFRADEARQLTEAGIPAWQALADAYTEAEGKAVSIQEVMKRAEAGQIEAKFAIDALRDSMQKTFGGSMEKQALTFLGTMEKVKDSLNIGLQTTLQSALPGFSKVLQDLLPSLEKLSFGVGGGFAGGLQGLVEALQKGGIESSLEKFIRPMRELIAELGPQMGSIIGDVAETLANWAPLIQNAVLNFYDLVEVGTLLGEKFSQIGNLINNPGSWGPFDSIKMILKGPEEFFSDELDRSQAKLTAIGTQYASILEAGDAGVEKIVPEIDLAGIRRGNLQAISELQSVLKNNPDIADFFDIDPQELYDDLQSALGTVRQGDLDKLTGEDLIDLDVGAAQGKIDRQLADIASAAVLNRDKIPLGVELDFAKLQTGTTASSEIQKLLGLKRKDFAAVLDIDISKVKAKKRELDQILQFQKYRPSLALGINVDQAAENLQRDMNKILNSIDFTSGSEDINLLVGAKINPADLQQFDPKQVRRLLKLDAEQLVELGVIAKKGDARNFKAEVETMLTAGGGVSVPVKPELGEDALDGLDIPEEIAIELSTIPELSQTQEELNGLVDNGPYEPTTDLNDLATPKLEEGIALQNTWDQLSTSSSHDTFITRYISVKTKGGGGGGPLKPEEEQGIGGGFLLGGSSGGAVAGSASGGGASSMSGGEGGGGLTASSASNDPFGFNKLYGGVLWGKTLIQKIKKASNDLIASGKEARSAYLDLSSSVGNIGKMTAGELGQFTKDLAQQAAALDQATFDLESSSIALGRAQEKVGNKIDRIKNKASKRADDDKDFKGQYKYTKGEKKSLKAAKKKRKQLNKREGKLENENGKQRLAQRQLLLDQQAAAEAKATIQTQYEFADTVSSAAQGSVDSIQASITDIQRRSELGELPTGITQATINNTLNSLKAALAEASRKDNLRGQYAIADILDNAVDGSPDSIKDSIKQLERQIALDELPTGVTEATARQTIASLQGTLARVEKEAKQDILKGILDPRSLRDLGAEGLDDWAQGIRDALEDSEDLSSLEKNQLGIALNRQLASLENYTDRLKKIEEANQLSETLKSSMGGSVDWNKTANPAAMNRALKKQTDSLKRYAESMQSLRTAGLSSAAAKRIAEMDPTQAAKFTQRLSAGGAQAIADFNASVAGFEDAIDLASDTAVGAAFGQTGKDAALGFVEGLESEESAIRRAMQNVGNAMLDEWKKTLGIASPSKVFAEQAAWVPAGMVKGIESGKGDVLDAMRSMVTAPSMPRFPSNAAAGLGRGGDINIDVHPREHMDEVATARAVSRELAWATGL